MLEKIKEQKRQHHNKRIRIAASLIVILSSIFIFSFVLVTNYGLFVEVLNSPQPRNFQITYSFNFENSTRYANINGTLTYTPDLKVILDFTYPDGTLVAGENITIKGRTILNSQESKNVTLLAWAYHNSYFSQPKYDEDGFPKAGGVIMTINPQNSSELIGVASIIWPIDGDYTAFGHYFVDYTGPYNFVTDDAPMHVFPREVLNQVLTNKVTVLLTIALFFFSLFGALDIGLRLWPHQETPSSTAQQEEHSDKSNGDSSTKNEKTNIQPTDNTKSKPKQSKR